MRFVIPRLPVLSLILAALLLGACQKKADVTAAIAGGPSAGATAVPVVKETERSRNFLAVTQQLELGGTLYGYVDVDGDVAKLTAGLRTLLQHVATTDPKAAPFARHDYTALATSLGLTDIKAIGVSSVPDGTGFYRNRAFFYTGGERHGLIAGLGGRPGPFTHVTLAPANASFFAEAELDLPVVYRAIKDVITQVAGEPVGTKFETDLKKAGEAAALSVLDLIYGLKGHSSLTLRLEPQRKLVLPGRQPVTVPGVSLLIAIDGVAAIVENSLAKSPAWRRTLEGGRRVYALPQQLPLEGIQPVVVAEGSTLYIASSRSFFDECRTQSSGLADNPEFLAALAGVGAQGNGLAYVSPRLFDDLRAIEQLNPNLPAESKAAFTLMMGNLPRIDRPLVTVRTNLPDGILVRSHWNRSLKQEVAMFSANPVMIGLFAAMAIPAFQKVRMASQEKAVLNNLRQLAAAADQFYLERNVRVANYADLVGPGKYIEGVQPVMGEDYRPLRFQAGVPLRIRLPDGRVVEYAP